MFKNFLKKFLTQNKNRKEMKEMTKFYSQFINPNDLCFDIGANLGNRTKVFSNLRAKVIAVEPQTSCVEHLKKEYKNNENVTIVSKAIDEKEGFAEIAICEDAPTISTMSNKWKTKGRFSNDYNWTKVEKIPTTTLDILIKEYGTPKFCKIDVEGFEKSVLKGLSVPIPFISFEFTNEFFEDTKACIAHLQTIGNFKFNCSLEESMELLSTEWLTPEELYKRLEKFDNNLLWGDIYAKLIH